MAADQEKGQIISKFFTFSATNNSVRVKARPSRTA
jgi:hypothetical protein